MEIITEIILELLIEILLNKKISKWFRYPALILFSTAYLFLIIALIFLGIKILKENIILSCITFSINIFLIIGVIKIIKGVK